MGREKGKGTQVYGRMGGVRVREEEGRRREGGSYIGREGGNKEERWRSSSKKK